MSRFDPSHPYRPSYSGSPFGRRFSGLLPWMFVVGIVVAVVLTFRHGMNWPFPHATDGHRRTPRSSCSRPAVPTSASRSMSSAPSTATPFRARASARRPRSRRARSPARHRCARDEGLLSAGAGQGRSRHRRVARSARPGRRHDLQSRPGQISAAFSPMSRRSDRQRFGGDARRRLCAQLQWRPSRRLVRARLALLETKKPRRKTRLFAVSLRSGDQRVTTTVVPTETRL